MSKQKIRSDFDHLKYSETKKIFAGINCGTWSFIKRVEISFVVIRMVLPGGSKLVKNETYCMMKTHS